MPLKRSNSLKSLKSFTKSLISTGGKHGKDDNLQSTEDVNKGKRGPGLKRSSSNKSLQGFPSDEDKKVPGLNRSSSQKGLQGSLSSEAKKTSSKTRKSGMKKSSSSKSLADLSSEPEQSLSVTEHATKTKRAVKKNTALGLLKKSGSLGTLHATAAEKQETRKEESNFALRKTGSTAKLARRTPRSTRGQDVQSSQPANQSVPMNSNWATPRGEDVQLTQLTQLTSQSVPMNTNWATPGDQGLQSLSSLPSSASWISSGLQSKAMSNPALMNALMGSPSVAIQSKASNNTALRNALMASSPAAGLQSKSLNNNFLKNSLISDLLSNKTPQASTEQPRRKLKSQSIESLVGGSSGCAIQMMASQDSIDNDLSEDEDSSLDGSVDSLTQDELQALFKGQPAQSSSASRNEADESDAEDNTRTGLTRTNSSGELDALESEKEELARLIEKLEQENDEIENKLRETEKSNKLVRMNSASSLTDGMSESSSSTEGQDTEYRQFLRPSAATDEASPVQPKRQMTTLKSSDPSDKPSLDLMAQLEQQVKAIENRAKEIGIETAPEANIGMMNVLAKVPQNAKEEEFNGGMKKTKSLLDLQSQVQSLTESGSSAAVATSTNVAPNGAIKSAMKKGSTQQTNGLSQSLHTSGASRDPNPRGLSQSLHPPSKVQAPQHTQICRDPNGQLTFDFNGVSGINAVGAALDILHDHVDEIFSPTGTAYDESTSGDSQTFADDSGESRSFASSRLSRADPSETNQKNIPVVPKLSDEMDERTKNSEPEAQPAAYRPGQSGKDSHPLVPPEAYSRSSNAAPKLAKSSGPRSAEPPSFVAPKSIGKSSAHSSARARKRDIENWLTSNISRHSTRISTAADPPDEKPQPQPRRGRDDPPSVAQLVPSDKGGDESVSISSCESESWCSSESEASRPTVPRTISFDSLEENMDANHNSYGDISCDFDFSERVASTISGSDFDASKTQTNTTASRTVQNVEHVTNFDCATELSKGEEMTRRLSQVEPPQICFAQTERQMMAQDTSHEEDTSKQPKRDDSITLVAAIDTFRSLKGVKPDPSEEVAGHSTVEVASAKDETPKIEEPTHTLETVIDSSRSFKGFKPDPSPRALEDPSAHSKPSNPSRPTSAWLLKSISQRTLQTNLGLGDQSDPPELQVRNNAAPSQDIVQAPEITFSAVPKPVSLIISTARAVDTCPPEEDAEMISVAPAHTQGDKWQKAIASSTKFLAPAQQAVPAPKVNRSSSPLDQDQAALATTFPQEPQEQHQPQSFTKVAAVPEHDSIPAQFLHSDHFKMEKSCGMVSTPSTFDDVSAITETVRPREDFAPSAVAQQPVLRGSRQQMFPKRTQVTALEREHPREQVPGTISVGLIHDDVSACTGFVNTSSLEKPRKKFHADSTQSVSTTAQETMMDSVDTLRLSNHSRGSLASGTNRSSRNPASHSFARRMPFVDPGTTYADPGRSYETPLKGEDDDSVSENDAMMHQYYSENDVELESSGSTGLSFEMSLDDMTESSEESSSSEESLLKEPQPLARQARSRSKERRLRLNSKGRARSKSKSGDELNGKSPKESKKRSSWKEMLEGSKSSSKKRSSSRSKSSSRRKSKSPSRALSDRSPRRRATAKSKSPCRTSDKFSPRRSSRASVRDELLSKKKPKDGTLKSSKSKKSEKKSKSKSMSPKLERRKLDKSTTGSSRRKLMTKDESFTKRKKSSKKEKSSKRSSSIDSDDSDIGGEPTKTHNPLLDPSVRRRQFCKENSLTVDVNNWEGKSRHRKYSKVR